MMVAWNVRGLNKSGKIKEVSSRLHDLHPAIVILIETRVKSNKAPVIRGKLGFRGEYIDNYAAHINGRLWIYWDNSKLNIRCLLKTSQAIHCGVYDVVGNFKFWLTAVYALNRLEDRKLLWKTIEKICKSYQGPWCLIGDYNNVANAQDRIGGNIVTESEFEDFQGMLTKIGLSEMDTTGDFFTWSNKQST